jgi:hypothetical protein
MFTLVLLYIIWYRYIDDKITLAYISVLITLPVILVMFKVLTGKEKKGLHLASRLMKLIMLAGILYSLIAGGIITSGKIL